MKQRQCIGLKVKGMYSEKVATKIALASGESWPNNCKVELPGGKLSNQFLCQKTPEAKESII